MPATTIHRVVRNTSLEAGGLYYFERDGRLLRPIPSSGLRLKPDATNGVWVYRVASQSGEPLPMIAPATLTIRYRDPDAPGALVDINAYTAATFDAADKCFKFDLSGTDFAAHNARDLVYFFKDSSAAGIAASLESVLLYEKRPDFSNRVGSWRILSAVVTGLSNRAVRFESTNPSVCRVERGEIASTYLQMASEQTQSDQYCVLIGVATGACQINCIAEGDENQIDVVDVEVRVHPEDVAQPQIVGGLAQQLADLLANVRIPISMRESEAAAPYSTAYQAQETNDPFFAREFGVPGEVGDTFDISLKFTGAGIPTQNARFMSTPSNLGISTLLVVGLATGLALGVPNFKQAVISPPTEAMVAAWGVLADLNLKSARVLNAYHASNLTADISVDVAFVAQGGDTIVVAWIFGNWADLPGYYKNDQIPHGLFHALMTVNSIVHHPANEEP